MNAVVYSNGETRVMINKRTRAQILQLVNEEGIPIRHVARMLGISQNTVKKYMRLGANSVNRASRLSDDGAFLASHKESVAKLYVKCELRCPPLQRLIEKELKRTIPLRRLQRFCPALPAGVFQHPQHIPAQLEALFSSGLRSLPEPVGRCCTGSCAAASHFASECIGLLSGGVGTA